MQDAQAAATVYIERLGFALVPIPKGEKGPRERKWNDPNCAVRMVRDTRLASASGWGVLHSVSGTCALDADLSHSMVSRALAAGGVDFDDLLQAGTPSIVGNPAKPPKLIYRVPAGVELTHRKLTWDAQDGSKKETVLELRAGKVQDILPPTIHPDTREPYRWAVEPLTRQDIPELPVALLELWENWDERLPRMLAACPWSEGRELVSAPTPNWARTSAGRPPSGGVIELWNATVPVEEVLHRNGFELQQVVNGERRWTSPNSKSQQAGVVMLGNGRIYSHHASDAATLGDHAHDSFSLFTELECSGDQGHALKAAAAELATRQGVNFSAFRLKESMCLHAPAAEKNPDRWAFSSVSRFLDVEPRPIEWVVPEFLPLGIVAMLAGAGGVMKSQAALQLAAAVALGHDWLGVGAPEPGSVLVLAAEDAELQLHHRMRRLTAHLDLSQDERRLLGERMHVIPLVGQEVTLTKRPFGGEIGFTDLIGKVIEKVESLNDCRLIVLDNKSRMMSGDENAAEDATRFVQGVEGIVESTGATALVIAHVNKTAIREGGGQEALRGSSAAVDGARWVATMARIRGDQGGRYGLTEAEAVRHIRLDVPKSNYTAPFSGAWLRNDEGVLVRTELISTSKVQKASREEASMQHAEQVLKDLLTERGPMSPRALRDLAGKDKLLAVGQRNGLPKLLARTQGAGVIVISAAPYGRGELVHLPGQVLSEAGAE